MSNSIGSFAREEIAKNPQASNQEILDKVKEKFQHANTSLACIAWYKSNMKKTGYKMVKEVAPRTHETVMEEIIALQLKLECLKEEHKDLLEKDRMNMLEQLEALASQLGIELPSIESAPPSQEEQQEGQE